MRLFVAIETNAKVVTNLTELVRRLRPVAPIRWLNPQNMHVTLKYVGDWPHHKVDAIVRALSEVEISSPLNVPLAGLGFFPNASRPKVFWVGAESTPPLRQLASGVDSQLQQLGVAPEVRPYQPHIVLGRVLDDEPLDQLYSVVDDLPSRDFGTISPTRFVLFESSLTAAGPVQRTIAEFPLVAAPTETPIETPALAGRI